MEGALAERRELASVGPSHAMPCLRGSRMHNLLRFWHAPPTVMDGGHEGGGPSDSEGSICGRPNRTVRRPPH